MKRLFQIEHNGQIYNTETGSITQTRLGRQDHGIFTLELRVGNHGTSRMLGGYALANTGFGMEQIKSILKVAGVQLWEELKGRTVLVVLDDDDRAIGLAHTMDDEIYIFEEHAENWRSRT